MSYHRQVTDLPHMHATCGVNSTGGGQEAPSASAYVGATTERDGKEGGTHGVHLLELVLGTHPGRSLLIFFSAAFLLPNPSLLVCPVSF